MTLLDYRNSNVLCVYLLLVFLSIHNSMNLWIFFQKTSMQKDVYMEFSGILILWAQRKSSCKAAEKKGCGVLKKYSEQVFKSVRTG